MSKRDLIQFFQSLTADRLADTDGTPKAGEPVWDRELDKLYMGDGSTPGGVPVGADWELGNAGCHPGFALANHWLWQSNHIGGLAQPGYALVTNNIGFLPIGIPRRCRVNALTIEVVNTGPGQVQLALYTNLNGLPDQLLANTASASCATAGWKVLGFSTTEIESGWYWMAFNTNSGTPTFRAMSNRLGLVLPADNAFTAIDSNIWFQAQTFGTWPATAGATTTINIFTPQLGLRASAVAT